MKKQHTTAAKISALLVCIIAIFFSCQKNASNPQTPGTTSFNLHLTDDPSFAFDAVFIDIAKVEVKLEDDSTHNENEADHQGGTDDHGNGNGNHGNGSDDNGSDDHGSGGNGSDDNSADDNGGSGGNWVPLDIRPGVYNVLNFRNGIDTLLGTTAFPSTKAVSKVRITLGTNNSVVLNGQTSPLQVNHNTIVINLSDDDVNLSGDNLNVFLDFDAGNSIRFNNGVFELHSSIKAFSKEKAGSIEGRVMPAAAKAVIYAINGTDTSTALPEREGEFKLIGLKPGTYALLVKATANGYQDATISNIMVGKQEDAHTGTITLHQ